MPSESRTTDELYGLFQLIAVRHDYKFAIIKLNEYAIHATAPHFLEYEYRSWLDLTVIRITALFDGGTYRPDSVRGRTWLQVASDFYTFGQAAAITHGTANDFVQGKVEGTRTVGGVVGSALAFLTSIGDPPNGSSSLTPIYMGRACRRARNSYGPRSP